MLELQFVVRGVALLTRIPIPIQPDCGKKPSEESVQDVQDASLVNDHMTR